MLKEARKLATETWREWNDDQAMQWGAAVSFYAALALAPLLVTVFAVVALLFEDEAVRRRLVEFVGEQVGEEGAETAANILADRGGGLFAGVSSAVFSLIGATAVFGQLQNALNQLWQVRARGSIRRLLKTRLLGLAMVLVVGALFLGTLTLQSLITALFDWGTLVRALNVAGSLALFTLLFTAVYKILPDVDIRWRDVWVGGAVTAVLFTIGQFGVGLYLGRATVGSSYGAAGAFVAVLVWMYYSSLVFFFGAEFTQVWARRHGRRIQPTRGARRVEKRLVEQDEAGSGGVGERGDEGGRRGRGDIGTEGNEPGADGPPERDRRVA